MRNRFVLAGKRFWLLQAFSGLALVPILAMHWIVQHYVVEGGFRSFRDITAYLAHPAFFAIEVVFLVSITAHSLLGVRAVVMDFGPSERSVARLNTSLLAAGLVTLGYGIWLLKVAASG